MNQQIYFKFILQYLEFSSKSEQSQYELTIMLKRGASQQTIAKLQVKNPERTSTTCRLPLDQTYELQQKMLYKDGEYQDCNIKFLFYLSGTQLIGDCVINLAFVLNNGAEQKIKKPLSSTNDKRAALLFKINLKQHEQSQEFPQIQIPAPTHQPPQTTRNASTRKMDYTNRQSRARSQSPPKEFKSTIIVNQTNEIQSPKQDNLTQKLTQLGQKFSQEKLQQSIAPQQQQQEIDNFKETVDILQQQEEELQKQLQQLDSKDVRQKLQETTASFGRTINNYNNNNNNNNNSQYIDELNLKIKDLEEKYHKTNEENEHLKRIIRQQSESLKKQTPFSSRLQETPLNQSVTSDQNNESQQLQQQQQQQQQYEKIIEKKNLVIKQLTEQILELEKNSNPKIVEQLKGQILRLEQQMQDREAYWEQTEKIHKEKIYNLMQKE